MPTSRTQTVLGASNAVTQSHQIRDQIIADMLAAGWIIIRASDDGIGFLLRAPALDHYSSHSDMVYVWANNTDGACRSAPASDFDVQALPFATYTLVTGAPGASYTGGGSPWPGGSPQRVALYNSAFQYWVLQPTGLSATFTSYASEFGVYATYDDGSGTANIELAWFARPLGSYRYGRNLTVRTRTPTFPITFSAPTGAAHVTFDIDGHDIDVTFPTGTALTAARIAQEVSLQTNGLVEAAVVETQSDTNLTFTMPYDAEPIFGYSSTTPHIAITYVDSTADSLNLPLFQGAVTTISTTELVLTGANWVLRNVRLGATIYNRTRDASTVVARFATTTDTYDTLVATFPGDWLTTDTYLVLPGPETYPYGLGLHDGHYQGCPVSSSAVITSASGEIDVVLNDQLGEAQGHYQVGQYVAAASLGTCVTITVSDITDWVLGDDITATDRTTQGVIRNIYTGTSQIVVDTLSAPSIDVMSPSGAWQVGDTVTGTLGGSALISSVRGATVTSDDSLGWYQRVPITAITQVDIPTGDYRTILTLDFSGINAAAKISPGFTVCFQSRVMYGGNMDDAHTMAGALVSNVASSVGQIFGDTDICRDDNNVNGANSPRWDPDYETGCAPLCALAFRYTSPWANGVAMTIPHLRQVNARTRASGDGFVENGDANRIWRAYSRGTGSASFGAGMTGAIIVLACIGPGAF